MNIDQSNPIKGNQDHGGEMFKEAKLALEDGTIIRGEAFGSETVKTGEVVFATGMTGYVESLTDPSYRGQILMPTYPLQGNYGVSEEWYQSDGIKAEGLIVREMCPAPSHRLSEKTLPEFLDEYGIPGIAGVDTRALTIKIREKGAMKGALATEEIDDEELLEMAVKQPSITEIDLVDMVCVKEPVILNEDASRRVVIVDCGIKRNSIDALLERDLGVVVVPYTTSPAEIMDYEPDGLLISSGPGDPTRVRDAIETVKTLSERLPIFGICLGQQIISLAFGARIYKMKFGHRGVNQPVKDLRSGTVSITSQNHGFTVDPDSVKGTDIEITQLNLNDGTPEGIEHRELPVFSVQYHPEAGPGPHDTVNIFDRFADVLREY